MQYLIKMKKLLIIMWIYTNVISMLFCQKHTPDNMANNGSSTHVSSPVTNMLESSKFENRDGLNGPDTSLTSGLMLQMPSGIPLKNVSKQSWILPIPIKETRTDSEHILFTESGQAVLDLSTLAQNEASISNNNDTKNGTVNETNSNKTRILNNALNKSTPKDYEAMVGTGLLNETGTYVSLETLSRQKRQASTRSNEALRNRVLLLTNNDLLNGTVNPRLDGRVIMLTRQHNVTGPGIMGSNATMRLKPRDSLYDVFLANNRNLENPRLSEVTKRLPAIQRITDLNNIELSPLVPSEFAHTNNNTMNANRNTSNNRSNSVRRINEVPSTNSRIHSRTNARNITSSNRQEGASRQNIQNADRQTTRQSNNQSTRQSNNQSTRQSNNRRPGRQLVTIRRSQTNRRPATRRTQSRRNVNTVGSANRQPSSRQTPSNPRQPSRQTPSNPRQPSRQTPSNPRQPSRQTPSNTRQPSRQTPLNSRQPSRQTIPNSRPTSRQTALNSQQPSRQSPSNSRTRQRRPVQTRLTVQQPVNSQRITAQPTTSRTSASRRSTRPLVRAISSQTIRRQSQRNRASQPQQRTSNIRRQPRLIIRRRRPSPPDPFTRRFAAGFQRGSNLLNQPPLDFTGFDGSVQENVGFNGLSPNELRLRGPPMPQPPGLFGGMPPLPPGFGFGPTMI